MNTIIFIILSFRTCILVGPVRPVDTCWPVGQVKRLEKCLQVRKFFVVLLMKATNSTHEGHPALQPWRSKTPPVVLVLHATEV